MGVIIRESGMEFGEYDENQVFWIEASEQYTKRLRQNGIKSCEFILRRGNNLYFIEAKSSCPRQILAGIPSDEKEKKKKAYDKYINDIVLKMRHSLSLYGNILLKRYSQNNIPNAMVNPNLLEKEIHLILVINTSGAWDPDPELGETLNQYLNDVLRIWRIKRLLVITERDAKDKHFIL